MNRIKMVVLTLIGALALGAAISTVAQAAEAPFWGVESKRLGSGELQEIAVTQTSEYTLSAGAIAITCKKSSVKAGATIDGSAAGEPGTSKESVLFKECTIVGNGTCAVGTAGNGEIVTEPLKDELVYDATSKESKSIAVEFVPETGSVLATITLVGAGCAPVSAGSLPVNGQIVAQAFGGTVGAEFLLELGRSPVLATVGSIRFPATRITSIILFKAGVATQKTVTFSFAGKVSKLVGSSEIALVSGKKWCIIS